MRNYDFRATEKKWQDIWDKKQPFKAVDFSAKPKYYVLSEFFGPSGRGIHLGHVKCYTPSEVIARYKRLKGFNVLYPAGWDAFGLPTENSAIKDKKRPEEVTQKNVGIFTNQLKRMGYSFDWSREINTSAEDYYKWTQWIFLQLYNNGLAYKSKGVVNYCPSCQTVLSNEDSQDGICDRCKNPVTQESRDVWFLRMKDYSEKMLEAIERIDMREHLKASQRHWIGRSEGAEVVFTLRGGEERLTVFTTRPDTLYGVTFMVLAPEHELAGKLKDKIKNYAEVKAYADAAASKSAIERSAGKEKTGVRLEGITAVNPVSGAEIPVFIADYVMTGYGTGAIMAVPAHDERDYAFAKKFGIPMIEVISGGDIGEAAYAGDGTLVNSGIINGLNVEDAKAKITAYLAEKGLGARKVNYKMQDWPFNRQRYWGEPFPIVLCDTCGTVPLDAKELPLVLPPLNDYTPDKAGNSPLSKAADFVNCKCPKCGKAAKRETDTMPNWAGSSWYWLRFMDPHNNEAFVSPEKLKYWGEVDLYTGGVEHVTRHMLYASFWHNFLYDIGKVPNKDPFKKRMCNGLILDENGAKMGKSSGNAIDPVVLIDAYGADAFRLHILFVGDYEKNTLWTTDGINGCTRFLQNVWALKDVMTPENIVGKKNEVALNRLIKFCCDNMEEFGFNTIIAEMMKFVGIVKENGSITREELRRFLVALNPMAPHITSEMYEEIFGGDINDESFPAFDESKLVEKTFEIPVQQNGKLKGTVVIALDEPESEVVAKAKALLGEVSAKKVIYVPNKIINIIC